MDLPDPAMARSRMTHKLGFIGDRDAMHALTVAAAACVLSFGLVYVGYFLHVLRIARKAPCDAMQSDYLLLFGKHAPRGRMDRDFDDRLQRAAQLWRQRAPRSIVLLGGGPPGMPTEAELARERLLALGISADAPLVLESSSRDTMQNLRNARSLLREAAHHGRVTLLSSRYHLARCALFARQLGIDADVCAAEAKLRWRPATLWRIAGEAAYVCWADLGTRWARLIGNQRMLARVT